MSGSHNRDSSRPPLIQYVGADVVGLIFSWTPAVFAWGSAIFFALKMWRAEQQWALIFVPVVASLSLILCLLVFRICLPKLRRGVYPVSLNRMVVSWWCQVAMGRALDVSGLRAFIFSSPLMKFLFFRAMGAKFKYRAQTSLNTDFVDYPLIEISEGVTIGEGTLISCHSMIGDKIMLKGVSIGPNVLVSANCAIGPGTVIKEGAYIGYRNSLLGITIEARQRVEDFQYDYGPRLKNAANKTQEEEPASQ